MSQTKKAAALLILVLVTWIGAGSQAAELVMPTSTTAATRRIR